MISYNVIIINYFESFKTFGASFLFELGELNRQMFLKKMLQSLRTSSL